ncbi:CRISPR-associated protein [Anaerosalibacter sp. Marseille-P3206]|uniref:CRISPR-associated protein n=1 Tax=Anaerosalibacter sp. Marseille-P3206 TaxID=1871005 RepID=UPI0009845D67|nr:type I CRISPR-associated protein Cas7 [Anaerosalibacter sp. Marseille-P3206]
MIVNNNSDFLFGFQSTLSNPNGDPDQENKPRMDYETSTILVSDGRRKRDVRDFLKNKGYPIFVDTLADQKVPMDKMFEFIRDSWLSSNEKMNGLFKNNPTLKDEWENIFGKEENYLKIYLEKKDKLKKNKNFVKFNNIFLTEIIKSSLIDIRLFGSAMAVEGVSRTYTGPIQLSWGYSLHPVELVKSSTITSIMNDDSSTFGKKYKLYYALISHYGTINKYNAQRTGMTVEDRELFRKSLVQSIMSNQTDSKQGQEPLFYLEVIYKEDFDGYLGDLRRFIDVNYEDKAIRSLEDLIVDFSRLNTVLEKMKEEGYIDKVIGWKHPFEKEELLINMPQFEKVDLWEPIKMEG